MSKKTEKPRKPEKNNRKNWTMKKNRLKFWKNQSVWFGFGFISLKPKKLNRTQTKKTGKKIKPNRKNRAKPENRSKPENRAKPVWTGFYPKKPNQTETSQFEPISVFFKKFWFNYFLNKNQTELKIITSNRTY